MKHLYLTATKAKWFTRSFVRRVYCRLETNVVCHSIFSKDDL